MFRTYMTRLTLTGALVGALTAAGCAQMAPTPVLAPITPQAAGLDPDAVAALDAWYAAKVADGERAGYVVTLAYNGRLVHTAAFGMKDIDSAAPMTADTRFRIASMTKPITTVAALMLVEDGRLGLDDPVSDYIPAMDTMMVAKSPMMNGEEVLELEALTQPITVRHLLTHTAGLGYLFDYETDLGRLYLSRSLYDGEGDLEAKINELAELPLYTQPGTTWYYSWADDVLGRVIEVAADQPFEDFLAENIFAPLGMTDTEFFPDEAETALMASIYTHGEDGALIRNTEASSERTPTWPSGGGGLVSTAGDYLRFGQMLLDGGTLGDVSILEPETVAMMTRPQVDAARAPERFVGMQYGFGVAVITDAEASRIDDRNGDFFWGGFFDTTFFVGPEEGWVAVVMTQNQPTATSRPTDTRGDLHRLVYGTLGDETAAE